MKGEDIAVKYLKKKGYVIAERNFHTRYGEIDIIARKDDVFIFIEVKRRSSESYGSASDAVTSTKQRKIIRSAEFYCITEKIQPLCRFDVIAIDGDKLTHIENAFQL